MTIVEFKLHKKKVAEEKNRGKLQCIIILLLRDVNQNNSLTKIKRKLEMKISKSQKIKGRKETKITQGSRGVTWFL